MLRRLKPRILVFKLWLLASPAVKLMNLHKVIPRIAALKPFLLKVQSVKIAELEHMTILAHVDSIEREKPQKVAMFMMAQINKEQLRLPILLMLLGAAFVIFLLGVILLIIHSFTI